MALHFEDFTLDPDRRELRRSDALVAVQPQVFDLIHYLVCQRERVVSKDDLLDAIWNGRAVSDSTLTSRINAARRALGDSGDEQRLIRTVSRKGFRFVGALRQNAAATPKSRRSRRVSCRRCPIALRSRYCPSPICPRIVPSACSPTR